ncbi:MAG: DUF502 domain-containing protein [Cypionkella sp.]|uniref:DUF502 domain-containing protein n=1 Tax=Cypionkella sp. TaxID=2811411 RepID=UPI002ABC6D99|nr:DUF502 domain-containing protein [Cypionkella sp.]MDZ4312445.1 DUF502 domain-containing protein [Cypionkella sp.]MDZ4394024.1 DUF502 domain-containing protein [Cypionkella sp.]
MSDPHPRRSMLAGFRASFLTGLVVVLPVGLTIYVVWGVIGYIDGWILPLIPAAYQPEALLQRWFGPEVNFPVRGVGVLVFLVFTALVGWLARGLIGRTVMRQAEMVVERVPLVRSVYSGLKQITETFFAKSEKSFERTCLVEFPRTGYWAVGMVATTPKGEIAAKLPGTGPMVAVFVGLTPMTSGMLLFVPAEDVIFLDMKADEAVKMIVSAGLVYPASKEAIAAVAAR